MGITFLFRMISKLLDKLDGLWMTLGGFTVDLDRIEELRKRRRFSHEGLVRFGLSYAPWSDRELKGIVGKYGGWQHITRLEYDPSEDLLVELENAGVSR